MLISRNHAYRVLQRHEVSRVLGSGAHFVYADISTAWSFLPCPERGGADGRHRSYSARQRAADEPWVED